MTCSWACLCSSGGISGQQRLRHGRTSPKQHWCRRQAPRRQARHNGSASPYSCRITAKAASRCAASSSGVRRLLWKSSFCFPRRLAMVHSFRVTQEKKKFSPAPRSLSPPRRGGGGGAPPGGGGGGAAGLDVAHSFPS